MSKLHVPTTGQLVCVTLKEDAGIDDGWRVWFRQSWGFRSMLEAFDQVTGWVVECQPEDNLQLCLFYIEGEPTAQAILEIPWEKIQEISCYVKARVV